MRSSAAALVSLALCLSHGLELLAAPIPGKMNNSYEDVDDQALHNAMKIAGINIRSFKTTPELLPANGIPTDEQLYSMLKAAGINLRDLSHVDDPDSSAVSSTTLVQTVTQTTTITASTSSSMPAPFAAQAAGSSAKIKTLYTIPWPSSSATTTSASTASPTTAAPQATFVNVVSIPPPPSISGATAGASAPPDGTSSTGPQSTANNAAAQPTSFSSFLNAMDADDLPPLLRPSTVPPAGNWPTLAPLPE